MNYNGQDRRREPRYPMEVQVVVRREHSRDAVTGFSLNISGGGIYLRLREPLGLKVGEKVTCEIGLPGDSRKGLPAWGIGEVVRVDEQGAAIEFEAGAFQHSEAE